jgi:hypothetical protein
MKPARTQLHLLSLLLAEWGLEQLQMQSLL